MPNLQNGQTQLNNSSAFVNELSEFVWPFCGIGAKMVKIIHMEQLMVNHVLQKKF